MPNVKILAGFPEAQRSAVAHLYWQAFGGKLDQLLGPEARALQFLTPLLDPRFCLSAQTPDGRVLGLAGFKTTDGGLAGGDWQELRATYGVLGSAWRAPLLSLLERDLEPDLLVMDGIVVAEGARGLGVGSRLLDGICEIAVAQEKRAVRLDVIDSNPRAQALYERRGFVPISRQGLGPFKPIFGFSTSLRMERPV